MVSRVERLERRVEELQGAHEEARRLLELSRAIIGTDDRAALFDAMSETLGEIVGYDRAALLLYRPETGALELFALSGRLAGHRPWPIGTPLALDDVRAAGAMQSRRPVIIDDLAKGRSTYFDQELIALGARAMLAVPLISKDRVIGMVVVASGTPRSYGERDAERLTRAATHIAMGVERMIAFEEVKRLTSELERQKSSLVEELETEHDFEEIVGTSPGLLKALRAVETVATTDATVLISGETGTGKELIARAVHDRSRRRGEAFVRLNCAAIPEGLVESELFGHERGAFTGALRRKLGRFDLADRGSIFLDEVGDLPLGLQSKLLRVLQEGEFERIGGTGTLSVDVRVIAATNRDLEREVAEGRFRSDLYYRLAVFPIELPPLRARGDDIRLLTRHFVAKFGRELGKSITTVSQETIRRLASYPWPGNVRELANVIERAVILSQTERLEVGPWFRTLESDLPGPKPTDLDEVQRSHILAVLELTGWRVRGDGGAAELLGLKPTTLEYRMKKLGVERPEG